MLNQEINLRGDIFSSNGMKEAIRAGFGKGLVEAGESDQRVVGLCADLAESTQMHLFQNKFPQRFVEVGVAEQNLAGVASGMAAMGKIPFISSYAMFSPGRNWEQIRTTICYNDRPVKIAGSHAGISVGPDGGTHQAIEDIAITRVLPRMIVISPCDAEEARKATIASVNTETPVYIRLAREKTTQMTTEKTPFKIGRAEIFWKSNNPSVGIIATGALLSKALESAKFLKEDGLDVEVLNLSTIKPLDIESIIKLAKRAGAIVTVEEHQVAGGMGSAVAELLAQEHPVPIEFVGIRDEFGQSGTPEELIEFYGLGRRGITEAIHRVLERK